MLLGSHMSKKQVKEIVAIAVETRTGSNIRTRDLIHVDNCVGATRYVRDAEEISRQLKLGASVLDLGCGVGHLSWLLADNGMKVTASEIFDHVPLYVERYNQRAGDKSIEYVPADILKSNDHALANRIFDAIVMYGVLEHVPDFALFLERCKAMLKTGGKLYIHQFPNKWSWREKIGDWMGNSSHELRFTPAELSLMLRWHGFQIQKFSYEQILPVNLTLLPVTLARLYYVFSPLVLGVDNILRNIPVLCRLSTSFCFRCQKAKTKS